jgi:hypothetical protein
VASLIISQCTAKARGLKRYFTGKPCTLGHITERYVASFVCVECQRRQNPKRKAAYNRKWRAANRDQRRKAIAKWRAANPDKNRQYDARQRTKRAKQRQADFRRWSKEHPEKFRAYAAHRRALKAAADGAFTEDDIQRLYKLQRGRCAYCRIELGSRYEIDHINPLSKGGSNYPRNLQLLCRLKCNQRKRNKDPIDYARSLDRLL